MRESGAKAITALLNWPLNEEGKEEHSRAKGITMPSKSVKFSLEWMTLGLHRSILGPGLNGQPAPILTAKLTGTASTRISMSRKTAVKMRGFDFIIFFLDF